ncbi:dolichyl-diphosphooligosaccharide--protein glycosyltransferase subunit 1 [Ceratocystis pirilliformis]|uniref:Dolichyl-diphosphooligosaccharide--protein glycosyltransferase subunit 1 n=1 Tax=Ceratocystis pirilliformis TaxID=259994 RepID=A0ABR3Z6F3_9PEZI
MRLLALYSTFVSLLATAATASANEDTITSRTAVQQPVSFTPPAVFKNNNLVRIVSLERNYAHETVNIQIQNIAKEPQDEYFLAFDSAEFLRIGGFEVKNKRDSEASEFVIAPVEYQATNPIQYYQIKFPTPLAAGSQITLGISFNILKAFKPLPASIEQDDRQFLKFDFSAYALSPYETTKQRTEIKFPSSKVPNYTKIEGLTELKGPKLTYGPFESVAAGTSYPASARYDFTKPVLHVETLTRDVEVSHWGGNIAFEENYDLYHRGANLSSLFNRVKWAQAQYMRPETYAAKELTFSLPVGSLNPYYTDIIGNVSTSHFRSNNREALLQVKPRYPIFGGWKYPFTVGWNSDASSFLRTTADGGYVLNIPLFEGPKQPEGVEYSYVNVQVLLPEGAENVRYYTTLPKSDIVESSVTKVLTYLDTVGRTAVIIKAENVVDDFRDRRLIIAYDYPTTAALRKPAVVFASAVSVFIMTYLLASIDLSFSRTSSRKS